ncbi:type VI secretion system baseplate subunit TssE [Achromobacter arsenitoxydans]|uniref:Type VI secretion system lysozyme-like protein n=1 Tax=Achromobacter arsenitoxydans SY8 TaxID=477184 RepID=H0FER4_9BURK|nr:type VI secretion system baseplate subunit TssE [Achromobacter arsenitoxydans]EHK63215.1 type VI secretion system lysozyme-like protein [Achromobacter arsenitoxydans SY8]
MRSPDAFQKVRYLPSLFDRLRDNDPRAAHEHADAYAPDAASMQRLVRRDLALLLNTCNLGAAIDAARHPHAASSAVNYGLPPLSGSLRENHNPVAIEKLVRDTIVTFEPRLIPESLSVRVLPSKSPGAYNVIHLEIRALMHWSPYPVEFLVKSLYDLESSHAFVDPLYGV